MKHSVWCLLAAVGVLGACSPEDSGTATPAGGDEESQAAAGQWVTLFDGSGLDAFIVTGDANWSIEQDAVGADSGNGMLVTSEQYADFDLEAEFWVDVPANSGIFIRCANPQDVGAATCYEVNIFDTRPDQSYRTGGIVNFATPLVQMNTGGRWNRYEIMADGDRLHVVLNGEVVVDIEDETFTTGHIGFQYGAGVVKFRDLRIRAR